VKPVKPTHPSTPAPSSKAPAGTNTTPTGNAPIVPPGQENKAESNGGGSKVKSLVGSVLQG